METIINQSLTEEARIRESLKNIGYSNQAIDERLTVIKSTDPERIMERNKMIRSTAKELKGPRTGYRPWLVHDMFSKLTGLSVNYINLICRSRNPNRMLKKGIAE